MASTFRIATTVVALLVLGGGWSTAQVPEWAVTHKHVQYPADVYILGVGYGTGEKAGETAKRLAQSDVAAQVRVRVQTEVKNVQQTYELNQNLEAYAEFKIRSTSIVDEQLTGAEIAETSVDSSTGTAYALAILTKENFASTISAELTSGWNQAGELHVAAEKFIRQGKVLEAIQDLIEARSTVTTLLPKQALHDAVARVPFTGSAALGPAATTSDIRSALARVRIEKKSGDKQKGKIGERFPEPFVIHVAIDADGKPIPAVGLAVAFLNASGETLGEVVSDANGTASFNPRVRGSIGTQVRARLSLPSAGKEFSTNLNSSSVVFECVLLGADVAFALKVDMPPSAVSDAVRSLVSDAVTRAGYHIVDMSRYQLRVTFLGAAPSTIDGMGGTLYSVSAESIVSLIEKEQNRTLGSVSAKSKGVAKTKNEAIEKSARSLKFDEEELISLLERAKN